MTQETTTFHSRNSELESRWDRIWRWSIVASVIFHLLLFLLFRSDVLIPETHESAAGDNAGDPRAAAGGGMEAISFTLEVPPPVPAPIEKPPEPVPVPDAERPQVEPVEETRQPAPTTGQTRPAGPGTGQQVGPGTDTGTGRGAAGTGDTGESRVTAPSPRGLILAPSDRPSRVRGKSVTVYVFVTQQGRVVADSTRLNPGSGDAKFDTRLKQQAADWRYRPATRGGTPIAAWFQYTMTF
ncbi:MAG TPA: energy transducer TonB [Longimicrobiales bacterium]|nr:energy transducer TonB [Longimicrobiales bacterium]